MTKPSEASGQALTKKVYIVSGDVDFLINHWIDKVGGPLTRPGRQVFQRFTDNLLNALQEALGDDVEIIYLPYDQISEVVSARIRKLRERESLPVVSFDPVYFRGRNDLRFDTTRLIEWNDNSDSWVEVGKGPRPGKASIWEQRQAIIRYQGFDYWRKARKVIVVDDGVWKRGTLAHFEQMIAEVLPEEELRHQVTVDQFLVVIQINHDEETDIHTTTAPVEPLFEFGGIREMPDGTFVNEQVVDWVCQRDFLVGSPYSGRTAGEYIKAMHDSDSQKARIQAHYCGQPISGNFGAPYVAPLGWPVEWASIPKEKALEFSQTCLGLAIDLFTQIEKATKKTTGRTVQIKVSDLNRPPFHLRHMMDWRLVDALQDSMRFLENNPDCVK